MTSLRRTAVEAAFAAFVLVLTGCTNFFPGSSSSISNGCFHDLDCHAPLGQVCDPIAHHCVWPVCTLSSQCAEGQFCDAYFHDCRAVCESDRNCLFGETCKQGTCSAGGDLLVATVSEPDVTFSFGSDVAGAPTSPTIDFDIPAGSLETYELAAVFPTDFGFAGFDGGRSTTIGTYTIDVDADGRTDGLLKLRALSHDEAFLDVNADGVYTPGLDSLLRHRNGSHVFHMILPNGGDGKAATTSAPQHLRSKFTLMPEILTNPLAAGSYMIKTAVVSVDPDTGGADDGAGTRPGTTKTDRSVSIVPLTVSMDIKPESSQNSINVRSEGVVPVAILTSRTFDAATTDVTSLAFGPGKAHVPRGTGILTDVDGDGDLDLLLHFSTNDAALACGSLSASLTGRTVAGQDFTATDSIRTVGCAPR